MKIEFNCKQREDKQQREREREAGTVWEKKDFREEINQAYGVI